MHGLTDEQLRDHKLKSVQLGHFINI